MKVKVNVERLREFCLALFLKLGVAEEAANIIVDVILEADLRGVSSHGLLRLPIYVKRMELGLINNRAEPSVVKETVATAVIDGDHGMGQYVATRAMEMAIAKAAHTGIGVVGVRNSTHFGVAAYYALLAVKKEQIGIVLSNTTPLMAPTGGSRRLVGNNPLCIAVPAWNHVPIVLDMACSNVAIGRIQLAAKEGRQIPLGWGLDREGVPTTDPKAVLDGGLLEPMAGYKGYGLALVIDILAGVLTGSGFGEEVTPLYFDFVNKQRTGHFLMAINIGHFINKDLFYSRLGRLIESVKNSPRAPEVKEIFLPGEIEEKKRQRNLLEGLTLPRVFIGELSLLADKFGLRDLFERVMKTNQVTI
ncbi:Ldh family oxidoreductase [Desulfofundulus thermocisternus]|uniref:Ldh family oxidoreductase n=1 Tax=Desulfofundulus thermocisternus TaxID=42471 RepID=UPI000553C228|nr:Ldh family oxidoreductase [Desulfofundulus thermocisternus]